MLAHAHRQTPVRGTRSRAAVPPPHRSASTPNRVAQRGLVQRACLPASECQTRAGSAVQTNVTLQQQESGKREARVENAPPAPAQPRSGTHGARAVNTEAVFDAELPGQRAQWIHGVFVDEDAASTVGARITDCAGWAAESLPAGTPTPQFDNATHRCIFVSPALEREAKEYTNGASTIGGRARADWQSDIIGRLTHEVTHERFLEPSFHSSLPFPPESTRGTCSPRVLDREISELAAEVSEFPLHQGTPSPNSNQALGPWLTRNLTKPGENIPGTIRRIRCSCACTDADALIRAAFDLASRTWTDDQRATFHAHMKRGEGKGFYWPFAVPPRQGAVGANEFSLSGGVTFTGDPVAMLAYRHVLLRWASGRLRLTAGAEGNVAAALVDSPREYGAGVMGLQFVQTPRSTEKAWGGFTARLEAGVGAGSFALNPAGRDPTTQTRGDYVLQVGAGVQFYIPGLTSMVPFSLEAALRTAQPIGGEAQGIHTGLLTGTFAW